MATELSLSGAQLLVNNETIPYMANSLKFNLGNPERKVDPQVVGNGRVNNVVSEDFATAKSMIMFDLKSTATNETSLQAWIQNVEQNVIKVISPDGSIRVFENCVVINKPEIDTGADGVFSVDFEGEQAVSA